VISITKAFGGPLLGALLCLAGTSAWADEATEVAALHAADQVWLKSYNSGDAATAASLYDEHAVLMAPGAPSAHGREAIRKFLAADMAESAKAGITFHLGDKPDGGTRGDLGWVSGTFSVTDKAGKVIDAGKYLSVSKKVGGKWLYFRDTWNSDGTPAAEAAPKK